MLLIYKPQYSLGRKRSAQRRYKKQRTQLPPFVPLEKEITFRSLLLFVVSQKKKKKSERKYPFTPFTSWLFER